MIKKITHKNRSKSSSTKTSTSQQAESKKVNKVANEKAATTEQEAPAASTKKKKVDTKKTLSKTTRATATQEQSKDKPSQAKKPRAKQQPENDKKTTKTTQSQVENPVTQTTRQTKETAQSSIIKKSTQTKPAQNQQPQVKQTEKQSLQSPTAPLKKTEVAPPSAAESNEPQSQQNQPPATDEQPTEQYQHPGPQYAPKYIVQITPELAPLAKVGGLADVVTGLSRELEMRGNSVEIILPKYDCMRYDHIYGLCVTFEDLWVPWYGGHVHCTVWFGFVHGRKCFFIEPHSPENFFNRGAIYGFDDDILRFAFFSRAALEFMLKSGKHPDIIHCHDWQTALVPVLLYEIYQHIGMTKPRVCFTIHNFKHQGVTGEFVLDATNLHRPDYYFHYDRLLDNQIPRALNLMKGGIVYSNFITTVSPRYADETKNGGQGFELEPTLHHHHYKYGGVVNGIDYEIWNPEIDTHIAQQYGVANIEAKYSNKHVLRQRMLLAECNKPIIAFIGRLDPQKGLDLVRHTLFYALQNDAQFVLLGSSPDQDINNYFWELKRHLNESQDCHIEVGFDEDLAHLIYAGADMMIVPSLFEPCGLTQLVSMKYGTIPVVRAVGGLADTVFDKDNAHDKQLHERNGYVFNDYNNPGIESALSRAISCYYQYPKDFRELIANAMRSDYSWRVPGQNYLNIYDYIANN